MIKQLHFEEAAINYIASVDFTKAEVFYMGQPPTRVDFLTKLSGVDYADADKEKIVADVGGIPIPILNLNHLVLSKISNNRTKDRLDVEELQKIQKKKWLETGWHGLFYILIARLAKQ